MIPVYGDKKIEFISIENISRIYTVSGKVVILSDKKEYTTKYRLYELEEILGENFIRISNTDIVNMKKVKNFDMSITGSIHINFLDGDSVYASRRYISAIKNS